MPGQGRGGWYGRSRASEGQSRSEGQEEAPRTRLPAVNPGSGPEPLGSHVPPLHRQKPRWENQITCSKDDGEQQSRTLVCLIPRSELTKRPDAAVASQGLHLPQLGTWACPSCRRAPAQRRW